MFGSGGSPVLEVGADMVTVADFDADGFPEFVFGRRCDSHLLVWAESASSYQPPVRIDLEAGPVALASADFNRDGTQELAVALDNATVQYFSADADLNFSLSRTTYLPAIACDLEVQLVGDDVSLIVATAAGIHRVCGTSADVDVTDVPSAVSAASDQLEAIRSQRRVDVQFPEMTVREREVVVLARTGLTAKEIGARLFIADRTVETHLAHAYSKLGVRSRFELVALHLDLPLAR